MIKLQLLPDYVFEGDKIRRNVIVCTILLLLVSGASIQWMRIWQNKVADMKGQATAASKFQTDIAAIQTKIETQRAMVAPFDIKREYMGSLGDFGTKYTAKVRQLGQYIYNRVDVLSCTINEAGFSMAVRTKTTEDVARTLMCLKAGYRGGLFAQDSVTLSGFPDGWPNATSPSGYATSAFAHINLPFDVSLGGRSPVNSGATELPQAREEQALQGVGQLPAAARGLVLGPAQAARLKYIKASQDPPDQPYMNLTVEGKWTVPIVQPAAGGAAGAGGMGGMGGGMGGMGGGPGAGGPMGGPGASGPGAGGPMGGPGASGPGAGGPMGGAGAGGPGAGGPMGGPGAGGPGAGEPAGESAKAP